MLKKSHIRTIYALALAGMTILSSCSQTSKERESDEDCAVTKIEAPAEVVDSTATNAEEAMLSEDEATDLIKKLWKGLPDHGINSNTKSSLTSEFYALVKKGFDIDERIQAQTGDIGPGEDLYYWYTGQDSGPGDKITSISITEITPDKASAKVKYKNFSEISSHTIVIKKSEDGTWRIDDFDNMKTLFRKFIKNPGFNA